MRKNFFCLLNCWEFENVCLEGIQYADGKKCVDCITECPLGYEITWCNTTHQATCHKCPNNFYSPHGLVCHPCRDECLPGQKELVACGAKNRICQSKI